MTARTFGTDNAAPCWHCDGTVATYIVDPAHRCIDVVCVGCRRRDYFTLRMSTPPPTTAAEASAAHRKAQHGILP